MLTKRNVITSVFGFAIATCLAATPASAQDAPKKKVVATFSILGDLVRNVGGDRIDVSVLVGPDGDTHVYSPSPADARSIKDADIVFQNGLKFEGWMERLVSSSGTKAGVVTASTGIEAFEEADDDHGHSHDAAKHAGHDHETDPHAWQSVPNVKIYVANIRDGLIAADPEGKTTYEENASAYLAKLDRLDADIRTAIGNIPQEKRKIITNHDAFGYFAREYGIEFIAPQGVSSDAEASARDVANIIRQIKKEKIAAVFIETISDPRLMERIARETKVGIGGRIYSDSLSSVDGPAGTYIDMMNYNIRAFASALTK